MPTLFQTRKYILSSLPILSVTSFSINYTQNSQLRYKIKYDPYKNPTNLKRTFQVLNPKKHRSFGSHCPALYSVLAQFQCAN